MARSFSQEPRSDSHKIGETRYRMSHLPSTTAIARTLLLAGILLAVTVLAARTFLPAFAQEAELETDKQMTSTRTARTPWPSIRRQDPEEEERGRGRLDGTDKDVFFHRRWSANIQGFPRL